MWFLPSGSVPSESTQIATNRHKAARNVR
jgi:hypothetical protein